MVIAVKILFPWLFSAAEAWIHHRLILADGSKDSLKEKFHALALVWRCAWIFGLGWYLNDWIWVFYAWMVFGYVFNVLLSKLRGLDPWYVSRDPRAAVTDRVLVMLGGEKVNRLIRIGGLIAGLVGQAVSIIAAQSGHL